MTIVSALVGRGLANLNNINENNPAYQQYVGAVYNGTDLGVASDPFAPANGGYYVSNVALQVYGYQRMTANCTTLTIQVCFYLCDASPCPALFRTLNLIFQKLQLLETQPGS